LPASREIALLPNDTHRFTEAQVVALFAYALEHTDEDGALVALQASSTSETPLILLLRRALEAYTPDAMVMWQTFEHLCTCGRADVVVRLMLEHEDSRVRSAAATALGRRPDAHFIPTLTQALGDPARNVVASASYALDRVREHSGPPPEVRVIPPSPHKRVPSLP
jgi:HEAT repeats